ncbi:MAG: exodeoxyribonuclease VII small subunit [Haliea sp.]|nr:exodeoxyribonuclease VII small subunit [Haliea sp.]
MPSKKTSTNFASTLQELEALARRLEDNNTPLEQSLKDFESGVQLIRQAQKALQEAEQKVQMLLDTDGGTVEVPFADDVDEGEVDE